MPLPIDPHHKLTRQIETITRLDEGDRIAIRGLPMRTRVVEENRDIFREGLRSTECCVILSGVACRYKIVAGGRRQILSFHFAGDMPDLQSLLLERMDHSLGALSRATVAFISHDALRAVGIERPTLATAFNRQALVDGSIFREWIANVGRRVATERVSHLICECYERMRALGLTTTERFELPITQNELGDATGLSTVHINRTMQALRKAGLVVSQGKVHSIPDWRRLRETADYSPDYLHLLAPLPG